MTTVVDDAGNVHKLTKRQSRKVERQWRQYQERRRDAIRYALWRHAVKAKYEGVGTDELEQVLRRHEAKSLLLPAIAFVLGAIAGGIVTWLLIPEEQHVVFMNVFIVFMGSFLSGMGAGMCVSAYLERPRALDRIDEIATEWERRQEQGHK